MYLYFFIKPTLLAGTGQPWLTRRLFMCTGGFVWLFRLFMCTGGIVRLKRKKFVVGGKVPGQNEDDGESSIIFVNSISVKSKGFE